MKVYFCFSNKKNKNILNRISSIQSSCLTTKPAEKSLDEANIVVNVLNQRVGKNVNAGVS